jgi:hypothetical protein
MFVNKNDLFVIDKFVDGLARRYPNNIVRQNDILQAVQVCERDPDKTPIYSWTYQFILDNITY